MSDQLNLSSYETAEEASKAFEEKLKEIAEDMGQKPDLEVTRDKRDGVWIVFWDGGPWEWAIKITGGVPILAGEPEIIGFRENDDVDIECKNRHAVSFYDR